MQKSEPNPLNLQSHLDRLYESRSARFEFKASSVPDFMAWKAGFLEELRVLLGIGERQRRILRTMVTKGIDHSAYQEEKFVLYADENDAIPFYLLTPKTRSPYRTLLVFHGHDPSVQYCMGNIHNPEEAAKNATLQNNYAQFLAESGFLVAVVEQRGMSARLSDLVSTQNGRSCRHLAFSYSMQGRTLLGERILDGMAVISLLQRRSDLMHGFGCTGHSGGGTTALWLTMLDERIKTAFISGCFSSYKGSILAMEHCECNYLPGVLNLGEMGDLAALIAPRPLCILQGEKDELFPIDAAKREYEKVRKAYDINGKSDEVELVIHPDGHCYQNAVAREWFDRRLDGVRLSMAECL